MPIKRLTQSSLLDLEKYSSMLAGNPAFIPNSFDLLETIALTTNVASVSFSGLGAYSAYKHLQIRSSMRANGNTVTNFRVRLNTDSGTNYSLHRMFSDGSTVFSDASSALFGMFLGKRLPGDSTAGSFTSSVMEILDFASPNKNTTVRNFSGFSDGVNAHEIILASSVWVNTSAVTEIEINAASDSFVSGCRFSLYGIKG